LDFLRGWLAGGGGARLPYPAGSGVVAAGVTSVGASALTRRTIGRVACRAGRAAVTGCSGHTAVAKSSVVANRSAGSLDIAREIAADRCSGMSARRAFAEGTGSKICLYSTAWIESPPKGSSPVIIR
jgi:hypothetical protein